MQVASTKVMTQDGDDKGLDEHTRIGVAPTPKLPGASASVPPGPASAAAGASAPDEHTQVRATPPPQIGPRPAPPSPPAGAEPAAPIPNETMRRAVAPPLMPPAASAAGPASAPSSKMPQPAAPPPLPEGGGDFAEHTILLADLQRQAVPAARLQRLQPPGRSDIVSLERTHYLMGRLPSCDLRLYSQTASREHAQLTVRDGRWYLTPVSGKVVLVNGSQVKEEVPLTHKMRLQLGGDELLFLDEGGAKVVAEVPPGAATFAGNRLLLYVIGALVLAGAFWLWVGR
jgi:hypothetical protein